MAVGAAAAAIAGTALAIGIKTTMTWANWIPAISSSTVLAIVGFLVGTYYRAKVEKAIQYSFDRQLEQFKANLRRKDEEIAAMRSAVLSGLIGRNSALDKRRLKAAEQLWTAVIEMAPLRLLAKMAEKVNVEAALQKAAKQDQEGEKTRAFAKVVWDTAGLDSFKPQSPPDTERPFISPIVWAHFSAYRQVMQRPWVEFHAMKGGIDKRILADPKPLLDLVKSVLPHFSNFIDEHGASGLPYLAEILENSLLYEITKSLDDPHIDEVMVERTAKINELIRKFGAGSDPKIDVPEDLRVR